MPDNPGNGVLVDRGSDDFKASQVSQSDISIELQEDNQEDAEKEKQEEDDDSKSSI